MSNGDEQPGKGLIAWLRGFRRGSSAGFRSGLSQRVARSALHDAPMVQPREHDGREMPGYLLQHRALNGIELRYHGQAMFAELVLPGGSEDPVAEAWEALSGYFNGENHEGRKLALTTPLIQTALGDAWRFWLPVSVADRVTKLPVPNRPGLVFNVMPSPRVLALQVENPDDSAQLSAAIEALTQRVAEWREELPASMSKRPMATEVMIWRYKPAATTGWGAARAEVAVFVL